MSEKLREAARHVVAEATSGANDHEYYQISDYAINDLRAALAEPETCVWRKKYGVYVTECGHELLLEHGEIAAMEFCPFKGCGNRIEVKG